MHQYWYLHGFASAPGSSKAQFFKRQLSAFGIELSIPDLNTPSFKEMTVSTQVALVESLISKKRSVLIGSSMGGLVATLVAARREDIDALILMAPGFGIEKRWESLLDENQKKDWLKKGAAEFFHYGNNRNELLGFTFARDLENRDTENLRLRSGLPTLVFHGKEDDVVPIHVSRKFAAENPSTSLHELDDDHSLLSSLDTIWSATEDFLDCHKCIAHRNR